jgi:polyvinyl alcohol dehydrogenase (cytochrome)
MNVRRKVKGLLIGVVAAGTIVGAGSSVFAQGKGSAVWPYAGGDLNNTRNAANEKTINAANVAGLHQKWAFTTHGDVSATPTVQTSGNVTTIYAVDWGGYLYSIDGNTGVPNWSKQLSAYTGNPNGSVSRTSPAIVGNNIIIGDQGDVRSDGFSNFKGFSASVMAINKNTGALVWRRVVSDHPFSVVTSSPVSQGNVLYVGVASLEENAGFIPGYTFSWRGKVVALDVNSGADVWANPYTTIEDSVYYQNGPATYTGASVWGSTPVVDPSRGSLYVTTGNNYSSPAGTGRPDGPATPPGNHIDSVLALDLGTGNLKWAYRAQPADTWDVARWVNNSYGVTKGQDATIGPDYDFGSGVNLITLPNGQQVVGAGEKSGQYHALNPDTGALVWKTQVDVGGTGGGIEWGSAVDGTRIYCAISNSDNQINGLNTNGGLWAALDAVTGAILWKTADPIQVTQDVGFPYTRNGHDFGMVTVANGVVFAGSTGGAPIAALNAPGFPGGFFALDATTGAILWQFPTDGGVNAGASVVNGTVYWGSGYSHLANAFGISGTPKLYAFSLK